MMLGKKGMRLDPLGDPPSTARRGAREEVGPGQLAMSMPRSVGGTAVTAVSRPAQLTSLKSKAAVQRYMQVRTRLVLCGCEDPLAIALKHGP